MQISAERLHITAKNAAAQKAAEILRAEIDMRAGSGGPETAGTNPFTVALEGGAAFDSADCFEIAGTGSGLSFRANGVRGLVYAVGLFLRKSKYRDGVITVSDAITGSYRPEKPIRGHQLGYRPCSNTYDAWDVPQFERYMTELMYFGMNTVEFIPFTEQNALMKYDGVTMTALLSEKAHALGLDVSLWIPNGNGTEAQELTEREALFQRVPHIDAVFVPGSDPGDLPADTLIDRCLKINTVLKRYHPDAGLWPSAQAPHNAPSWGEDFLRALKKADGAFAGVITGPNRAFNIDVLYEKLQGEYPIRFYPDITHNLRCEHPVHFEKDDWHYAFAAGLSRESINPRPLEYRRLHENVSPYSVGSVTYSDGVNDDVNKAVWCALDWDGNLKAEEIVEDYARVYLYRYDTDQLTAAILLLEKNWESTPLEKRLDFTYHLLSGAKREKNNCWRLWQLYFRAACDLYIKERLISDSAAAATGRALILAGDIAGAKNVLAAPLPAHAAALRQEIETAAKMLNETAGMQLSVKKYGASGWERGATLDTIDLPVTDKEWLRHLCETADENTLRRAALRNEVGEGAFYFSVALTGLAALWVYQKPDFYMNFQGDRPNVNNGTLPVCLQKVYDHYSFAAVLRGCTPGTAYDLSVTYFRPTERFRREHTAKVNGHLLAPPVKRADIPAELVPEPYCVYTYHIPAEAAEEQLHIEIDEPKEGFQLAEFRVTHREETA